MDKSKWDGHDWRDWVDSQSTDSVVTELQCQYNELTTLTAENAELRERLGEAEGLLTQWVDVEGIDFADRDNSGLEHLPLDTMNFLTPTPPTSAPESDMVVVKRKVIEEIIKRAEWEGMLYGDGICEPDEHCNLCSGGPSDHDADCPINVIKAALTAQATEGKQYGN